MKTTLQELTKSQREKIINFLRKHPVGALATISADGDPYASAIYIAVDDELTISFTTKNETAKYKNIVHHNKVSLVVFDPASQTSVQVDGQAVKIDDPYDQQATFHSTIEAAKQTGGDTVPPIAKISAGQYVGFSIKIKTISLSEYGWGNNTARALEHAADKPPTGDPA